MSLFIWLNEAEQVFNQLRDVFMKISILRHFDSEWHIHIEINAFNYAVASILSQSDDENQWHSIAFWFRNVLIFHLCTLSAVNSAVFNLIALFITNDHSCTSFVIFIMLVYMKNLSSSVQHHKIIINVYCKNVSVKRCKKCVERDVECVKIKFSIEKNSKKCALCAVFEANCQYES